MCAHELEANNLTASELDMIVMNHLKTADGLGADAKDSLDKIYSVHTRCCR